MSCPTRAALRASCIDSKGQRANIGCIMARIEIYTSAFCPYCHRAKALLERKGAAYEEIDVTMDSKARAAMSERSHGGRTVPQIFIGDTHVGGCDDLHALDAAGKLDAMLAA